MGLFAIGDLHFGFAVSKPMDIFGENWKNHSEKIIENWKREVTEEDTVLLPGDISWGMRLPEAAADLDVIDSLPGRKIRLSGNHDYWWKSSSRLAGQYPEMAFLKNDAVPWKRASSAAQEAGSVPMSGALRRRMRRSINGSRFVCGCLWMRL